jgi:hypothetical protein
VLVFITPNSLESTWVGKEVRSALSRHRKNETRVIPVIIQNCDWKKTEFENLLSLPKDGLPLDQWDDRSAGINSISEGVLAAAREAKMPAPAPKFAIFLDDDLREMADRIEQSIRTIRKVNIVYPVLPTSAAIEIDRLEIDLKEITDELHRRNELR